MKRSNGLGSMMAEPLRIDDATPDENGMLELIELGGARQHRQELFKGRRATLGLSLPNFMGVFTGILGTSILMITGLLSDVLAIPLDLISLGVDEVLTGFAGIIGAIPLIGTLASTALLAVNVLVQAALDLPIEVLKFAGNLGKAFKTLSPAQQAQFTQLAMAAIIQAAPEDQKSAVEQKLSQAPPPGSLVIEDSSEGGFPYGEVAVGVLNAAAVGAFFVL